MEEYKARVLERQPIRMEIGAVFSHAPSKHNVIAKEATRDTLNSPVFIKICQETSHFPSCPPWDRLCLTHFPYRNWPF